MLRFFACVVLLLASPAFAQVCPVQPVPCPDGTCPIGNDLTNVPTAANDLEKPSIPGSVILSPLSEGVEVDLQSMPIMEAGATDGDVLDWIINATIRVTVGGDCGSGTLVGPGLILTNAHVAGTRKGRVVNVQRWDQLGKTYKGQAEIIASGYNNDSSIDFALLRVYGDFAKGVKPIPMADRVQNGGRVTTSGCPRCEWPSTQAVKITKSGEQIVTWVPEAISGRSGSGVLDYTDQGPRLVALLTWKGGGQGLGQSSKMVLAAIRGRLPTSFERLPAGISEVGTAKAPAEIEQQQCDCERCKNPLAECK